MRNRNHDSDYEIINGKRCLRDRKTFFAGSVRFMDSAVASRDRTSRRVIGDATNSPMGLHKPGWRVPTRDAGVTGRTSSDTGNNRAVAVARQRYQDELTNAWRNPGFGGDPTITGAGERGSVGQREGDLCTINGHPGHLRRGDDGHLYCQPDASAARGAWPRYEEESDDDDDDNYEETEEEMLSNANTHTESAVRRDHRTVAQMMRDHQNKMADIYDKLDHELSETWRRS